jgi:2-oxoisovalerate dehydrogenase E2 component (dihydrolipoyl transacylase)
MTTFHLPDLGEGLAEAEIVRWHVKVGDQLEVDQPMLAVETAKAVVEVPAPYSGIITALHGKPGDVIATGAPLVEFIIEGAEPKATQSLVTGAHAVSDAATPATSAAPGAHDTGTTNTPQRDTGTIVGSMPTSDDELVEPAVAKAGERTGASRSGSRLRAAPAARAVAKRLGVELSRVQGTGRGGLITVDDVVAATSPSASVTALRSTLATQRGIGVISSSTASTAKLAASSRGHNSSAVEPEKLRGLRRSMAQSMSLARDNVTSCTIFDDADLHRWGVGQDVTTRLLRGIAVGCKAEPGLNAWLDDTAHSRLLLSRVDVGIAVDTPEGLIAPVVRDVGGRSSAQLRQDINRLKRTARDRSIGAEDLKDFTFMLSNFGMIAGRYATPVVVPPAVAILGAGRLTHDVVAVMGRIEAHLRLPLSLTFDHRSVTGGEAARFMAALLADLERET